jgi:hypothetical protein
MPRLAPPKNRIAARAPLGARGAPARMVRAETDAAPELEARAAAALEGRRGRSAIQAPPQAGALAARILKPILPPGSTSLADLKRRWPEIVGDKLGQLTAPDKLTKGPDGAVLTLTVASSAAPFVQHQTPLIIDRLRLSGCVVVAVTIKQGAVAARPAANVRPLSAPLSAEAEKALKSALSTIDDDRLKAALLRLGRAMGAPKGR